jgi:hypothetical protein
VAWTARTAVPSTSVTFTSRPDGVASVMPALRTERGDAVGHRGERERELAHGMLGGVGEALVLIHDLDAVSAAASASVRTWVSGRSTVRGRRAVQPELRVRVTFSAQVSGASPGLPTR